MPSCPFRRRQRLGRGSSPVSSVLTHSIASRWAVGECLSGAPVLGDDGICFCGPDEGLGVEVAVIDPFNDRSLEFDDPFEGAAADALAGGLGKPPLDASDPATRPPL